MNYYKTSQFVPDKGQAWMYTEADDEDKVLRTLTHLPATGETKRIPDPVVKKIYMKERLQPATAEEFLGLWNAPS